MDDDFAKRVTHHPAPSIVRRMLVSTWRQSARTAVCPPSPRVDGRFALVTGGGRGIGFETSRGLAARGAEVVIASRGEPTGERVAGEICAEFRRPAHFVPLDLCDVRGIPATLDRLQALLGGRAIDILVANAGVWPTRHAVSAQGHEIAFATNVLGHHALVGGAIDRGLLADGARIVIVTGDIYILADACTPDFAYRGVRGGPLAYCRSKLGNVWYAKELARRFPALRVHAVHPGVVASQLGGVSGSFAAWVKRAMLLPLERGAQTSLFCATQPGLPSGSYYHNVLGRVRLHPDDPGADAVRARELWDVVEKLA